MASSAVLRAPSTTAPRPASPARPGRRARPAGTSPRGPAGARRRSACGAGRLGRGARRCRRLRVGARGRRRDGPSRPGLAALPRHPLHRLAPVAGGRGPSANGQPEESRIRHQLEQHPEDAPARPRVPVAAAGLADVLVGDDHPAMLGRARRSSTRAGRGWPPRRRPRAGELGCARRASRARARRGSARARRSRAPAGPRPRPRATRAPARERRGEQLAELALEPRDLPAQVVARGPLGASRGAAGPGRAAAGAEPVSSLIEHCGQRKLLS